VALVGASLRTELPAPVMAQETKATGEMVMSQTALRPLEKVHLVPPRGEIPATSTTPAIPANPGLPVSEVPALGVVLLQQYLLPFELASILLLAGMIGAIVLARKERPTDDENAADNTDNTIDARVGGGITGQ
jgi:hypothetical protein